MESPKPLDFDRFYDYAPCGLILFMRDETIVFVNQTLSEWMQASKEELRGKKVSDLLDKGGKIYFQIFVKPLLDLHKEVKEINLQIKTAQGSFPCLFTARQNTEYGNFDIIQAVVYKISDRKKYESELLKKKTQAEEDGRIKADALDEVAFNQAHLVRAPLANILGLIALLDELPQTDDMVGIIEMLKESAEQLDSEIKVIIDKTHL